MNKLSIAIKLIQMLSEGEVLTSPAVADKFEVSERTAQRYLEELSFLPCVNYDDSEKPYRYTLRGAYHFAESLFDNPELRFLSALADYGGAISGSQPGQKSFGDSLKEKLRLAGTVYQFHYAPGIDYEKLRPVHERLEHAIADREIIKITYKRPQHDPHSVRVKPYRIIHNDGFWYLRAEDANTVKNYATDCIARIETTGEQYPAAPENPDEAIADSLWNGKTQEVSMQIDAPAAHYFQRKPCMPGQRIHKEHKDGSLKVSGRFHNLHEFKTVMFRWIPLFQVIEPSEYREGVRDILQDAVEKYE